MKNKKNDVQNFTKLAHKGGISLIVLVITIIVIVILAAAVILTLNNNNPIAEANQARYESDRANMQAMFTLAVGKVMIHNRATISIIAGQVNGTTSGVKETIGEVNYTVINAMNSNNSTGKIVFDKGTNTDKEFYTGKQLPIYAAGETKWYVDGEGNISLEVAGVKYGDGEIYVKETKAPDIAINAYFKYVGGISISTEVTLNNQSEVATPVRYAYYIVDADDSIAEYTKGYEGEELTYNFSGVSDYNSYNIKVVATSADGKTTTEETFLETPYCFVAGTKVLTETGLKNIEDIVIGEKVYSLNTDTNQKELNEVTNTIISKTNQVYKIKIGGQLVECTPKHQFYIVDKGWIRAKNLEVGDKIVAKDESSLEITEIETEDYDEEITTYNLTVENAHTYLITELELLVHNALADGSTLEQ